MADLIAIIYPDPDTAEKAMERVDWAAFDEQVEIIDACWISHSDGKAIVHPEGHPVAARSAIGGTVGLLIGALFALPVAGLVAGAAIGAHRGKKLEQGIKDPFIEAVEAEVASGGSALVVLYQGGADTERAGADLLEFGGTIRSTTIPAERLADIQARLDEATA